MRMNHLPDQPGFPYAGLADHGYAGTPDALAYRWSRDASTRSDAFVTLLRAIHDDSMSDALDELVAGRHGPLHQRQGQRAELVALMWLGRGDAEPEEWNDLVARAFERREVPTENYLLDHPLLAEHWLDGMERLNLGGLVADTD